MISVDRCNDVVGVVTHLDECCVGDSKCAGPMGVVWVRIVMVNPLEDMPSNCQRECLFGVSANVPLSGHHLHPVDKKSQPIHIIAFHFK